MIGKLLGLATVGGALASAGVLHRFLAGIAGVVMLAIVSGFMLCTLLAGAFYVGYLGLVHYGLDPVVAGLVIGGLALIVTLVMVAVTFSRMRRLRELSHRELPRTDNYLLDVGDIAVAFLSGFLGERR